MTILFHKIPVSGPTMPFRSLLFIALIVFAPFFTAPAQAAFLYCNRTQHPIEAAFGYREQVAWISEGWWQIQPGQCARVFNRPLTQRFYFYFARVLSPPSASGAPPMTWGGKFSFCVDNKAFKIEGDGQCEARGYQERGFQEIDIGPNQRDYTLNFEDGKSR